MKFGSIASIEYHYTVQSLFLKFLFNGIGALPLAAAQAIGAFLGVFAFLVSSHYRKLFKAHYLAVMAKEQLPVKLWSAAAGSGMLFADCLWAWKKPKKALDLVEVLNFDTVVSAFNEGHGMLMLTPHIGCFEVIPRIIARHYPATILYRPAWQEWLNEIVESGRYYPNLHFVPTNLHGVRQMTRALTRGEAIGILPDQVPSGGEGIWSPFFGRLAYTTTLPGRLANRHQTPVVMFTATRKKWGTGWLMQAKRIEPFSQDPQIAAQELNLAIENAILRAPEQFLWAYNRYKHPTGAELPPQE